MRMSDWSSDVCSSDLVATGHIVAFDPRRLLIGDQARPLVEDRPALAQTAQLCRPRPLDLKPIAALHFGQGFRRGRRRYAGFFGEILDANPIGRGFHNCLNDTRALPLKDRAESTARFLGLRPINQHVGSGRRDEERAAEIEITDTLLLKDIPRSEEHTSELQSLMRILY